MDDPYIVALFCLYDIFAILDSCTSIFHAPLLSVDGYVMFYSPRSDIPPLSTRPQGGVIVYVRKTLVSSLKIINLNSGNNLDMVVLGVGDVGMIFAYIVPSQSTILHRLLIAPWEALRGEVACLRATHNKILIMGDLNAHTGALCADPLFPRVSQDLRVDTYGRNLVSICKDFGLQLINGSVFEPAGCPTFFSNGNLSNTVIDYVVTSCGAGGFLTAMEILPPVLNLDHCPIVADVLTVLGAGKNKRIELKFSQITNFGRGVGGSAADGLLDRLLVSCHPEPSIRHVSSSRVKDSVTTSRLRYE